jgi:hypothetical protein
MAVMARDNWTDNRLDDLNTRVESIDRRMETGFSEMREEFRVVRGEMQAEFQAFRTEMKSEFQLVRSEISTVNRNLMNLTWGLIGTMLVGFLGTIVALVTQT